MIGNSVSFHTFLMYRPKRTLITCIQKTMYYQCRVILVLLIKLNFKAALSLEHQCLIMALFIQVMLFIQNHH